MKPGLVDQAVNENEMRRRRPWPADETRRMVAESSAPDASVGDDPHPDRSSGWLATGHTDVRKGFDGLALIVEETLKRDPYAGDLCVFRGAEANYRHSAYKLPGEDRVPLAYRCLLGRCRFPETSATRT